MVRNVNQPSENSFREEGPLRAFSRKRSLVHLSTVVIGLSTVAVFVLANVSGYIEHGPGGYMSLRWHHGWPLDYLWRDVSVDGDDNPVQIWSLTSGVTKFDDWALTIDLLIGLLLVIGVMAAVEWRRRRRSRLVQITLRDVLFFFIFVALFGAWCRWNIRDYDLQKRALDQLMRLEAGYQIDQGSPHWLREWVPDERPGRIVRFMAGDRITAISLGGPSLVDREFAPVAELPYLRTIEISGNNVHDGAFFYLRGHEDLRYLRANNSRITDAGLAHLAELTSLEELHLNSQDLSDVGLQHLRGLINLKKLHLNSTGIGDVGLKHLSGMHGLNRLELFECDITDAGLVHLRELTDLETLILGYTQVTDDGFESLRHLSRLRLLDLRGTATSGERIGNLNRALPHCRIISDRRVRTSTADR